MHNENPCRKCGTCCTNLSWYDRWTISVGTNSLMTSRRCEFLTKETNCSIYEDRPFMCVDWKCGVFYESRQ